MAMSSAYVTMLSCSFIGRSDVYILYKMGDRREPCETPDCIVFAEDVEFSILILKVLLLANFLNQILIILAINLCAKLDRMVVLYLDFS